MFRCMCTLSSVLSGSFTPLSTHFLLVALQEMSDLERSFNPPTQPLKFAMLNFQQMAFHVRQQHCKKIALQTFSRPMDFLDGSSPRQPQLGNTSTPFLPTTTSMPHHHPFHQGSLWANHALPKPSPIL